MEPGVQEEADENSDHPLMRVVMGAGCGDADRSTIWQKLEMRIERETWEQGLLYVQPS